MIASGGKLVEMPVHQASKFNDHPQHHREFEFQASPERDDGYHALRNIGHAHFELEGATLPANECRSGLRRKRMVKTRPQGRDPDGEQQKPG